ncbi:MAG: TIGR00730 family Rossman fold protein [Caulobacterales bacterium]
MDKTLISPPLRSICVYCGSSPSAAQKYIDLAADTGRAIAARGLRLVYGGGGFGLMGAAALAAHHAGGEVLGILPRFLEQREPPPPEIETVPVDNMHERKMMMFDASDAFVVLPGGIGTLEEAVETLSWRRLGLHQKPMVFIDKTFWTPFVHSLDHMIEENFAPAVFRQAYAVVDNPAEAMHAIDSALADVAAGIARA